MQEQAATQVTNATAQGAAQETAHPSTPVQAKQPFIPPQLTHHGRLVDITQKNSFAPVYQSLLVAETSP